MRDWIADVAQGESEKSVNASMGRLLTVAGTTGV
jgi:hypothetical protein